MKKPFFVVVVLALFGLLFLTVSAHAQNLRVDGVVTSRSGMPAPGASVAVLTQPANTSSTPGTPLALLCASATDTVCTVSNPVTADGLGNYHFYYKARQGNYTLQLFGSGLTTSILPDQVDPCDISGCVSGSANAVTPFNYSAKGDLVTLGPATLDKRSIGGTFTVANCSITSGSAVLTCTGAAFTSADVLKAIVVNFAGSSSSPCNTGAICALVTTIASVQSASQVTLNVSASNTVSSNGIVFYGTDDKAAIQSCVWLGTMAGGRCTLPNGYGFMVSNTSSAINFSAAPQISPGGILDGTGTILFAPQGVLTAGTNDRLFYIVSTEFTATGAVMSQIAAGALSKGATSFVAQNASDAAVLSPGDWVEITERDNNSSVEVDNKYIDWVQVSSVAGTTVNLVQPLRMAFPNAVTWSTACAVCSVSNPIGLGFRRVRNIMQDITIREINLIIPKVVSTNFATGFAPRSTRGLTIEDTKCISAAQSCYASNQSQGSTISNNHWYITGTAGQTGTEFGSEVDLKLVNNDIDQPAGGILGAATAPQNTGLLLDFGTGFCKIIGNHIGPSVNSGISTLAGLHDCALLGNTVSYVTGNPGGASISVVGGYRNVVLGNKFLGGTAATTGVTFGNTTVFSVNLNSDQNTAWLNVSNGFAGGNYSCASSNATDNCFDPMQGSLSLGAGTVVNTSLLSLTYSSASLNPFSWKDTVSGNIYCLGTCLGATATSLRIGANSYWDCYNSDRHCEFSSTINPIAAAGGDLGKTLLPWANIFLGTAATNNLKFQPAAFAAARVLSVPDPLGNVTLPYVIASGTSTLTANATLASVTSQAAITTAATNALTTDSIEWSYASAPTAGDSLCIVSPYLTGGNVNFVRSNPTAAAQNVSALVINWRVIR